MGVSVVILTIFIVVTIRVFWMMSNLTRRSPKRHVPLHVPSSIYRPMVVVASRKLNRSLMILVPISAKCSAKRNRTRKLLSMPVSPRSKKNVSRVVIRSVTLTCYRPDGICMPWIHHRFLHKLLSRLPNKLRKKLKQEAPDGEYPESIAFTLWGTDNIKTYGESLAQVLSLVGVRPVADSLGRVNKVELIPLEKLGRPRIDVVVSCPGVFRDLFINQMNLMDRGIKMAAEADEPSD